MIASLFHAWERHLASVTTNRVVRPFEWGLDWISHGPGASNARVPGRGAARPDEPVLVGGPACGGPGGGNGHRSESLAHLRQWVDEVMRDTDAFFDAPATRAYELEPARPEQRPRGEAGTLRFPSALATPHGENNTVYARWFPAASPRRSPAASVGRRGRAVVVLPQWNADPEGHIGLARVLARCGVSALRMSLPYHDARMPPDLARADYIVSPNLARTIQVCRQAVLDARRAVAWLALQGYERIGILGTSLGSCLAMLTAAHEPRIRAQALNHVSPWFADVVWRGLSTQHVRAGLDGCIDLNQLRDLWRPISPFSYLDRVRNVRTLLVYARYDLSFPVDLSRILVREFRRRDLPHQVAALPCGHYSTGAVPFKFLDGYLLTRFLLKNL
jgi:dienelactone hydrolase